MPPVESAPVRARAIASGRVQGVSYRQSTAHEARRVGVVGWVRNLPDGRVELVAEGTRAAVEALLTWCRRGPEHAEVSALDVSWHAPDDALAASFEVRK